MKRREIVGGNEASSVLSGTWDTDVRQESTGMNVSDAMGISVAVSTPIMILVFGLSLWWSIRRLERIRE